MADRPGALDRHQPTPGPHGRRQRRLRPPGRCRPAGAWCRAGDVVGRALLQGGAGCSGPARWRGRLARGRGHGHLLPRVRPGQRATPSPDREGRRLCPIRLERAWGVPFWLLVVVPGPRRERGVRAALSGHGLALATTTQPHAGRPDGAVWAPLDAEGVRLRLAELAGWRDVPVLPEPTSRPPMPGDGPAHGGDLQSGADRDPMDGLEPKERAAVRCVIYMRVSTRRLTGAFERYATGEWTLQRLAGELAHQGLTNRGQRGKPAAPITWQGLAKILANPVHIGVVEWNGVQYPGTHEPLVTPEVFRRVQELLAARAAGGRVSASTPTTSRDCCTAGCAAGAARFSTRRAATFTSSAWARRTIPKAPAGSPTWPPTTSKPKSKTSTGASSSPSSGPSDCGRRCPPRSKSAGPPTSPSASCSPLASPRPRVRVSDASCSTPTTARPSTCPP